MKRKYRLPIMLMLAGFNTMEGLSKYLKKGGGQTKNSEQTGKALKTG